MASQRTSNIFRRLVIVTTLLLSGLAAIPVLAQTSPGNIPPVNLEKQISTDNSTFADADDPNGTDIPVVDPAATLYWRFLVSIGQVENPEPVGAGDIVLTDDSGLTPTPVQSNGFNVGDVNTDNILDFGETWVFEATGTAQDLEGDIPPGNLVQGCRPSSDDGQTTRNTFRNTATVVILGDSSANDPAHYCNPVIPPPANPAINIVKSVNGQDANTPETAAQVEAGSTVNWTYLVTNIGDVPLTNVTVTDSDASVIPSCPQTTLAVGENMTCAAQGTAIEGLYSNIGTTTGTHEGRQVTDNDPSHYNGSPPPPPNTPAISIVKSVNGQDANTPETAVRVLIGSNVVWTYLVTNIGNVPLVNVTVTDSDAGVTPSCPQTTLAVGQSMTCSAQGTARAGLYSNIGTTTGTFENQQVTDNDPSFYNGVPPTEPPPPEPVPIPEPVTVVLFGSGLAAMAAAAAARRRRS